MFFTITHLNVLTNTRCVQLETLQELLRHKRLCSEIIKVSERQDGVYSSFLDGALAETHPIFSEDPTALQIILMMSP